MSKTVRLSASGLNGHGGVFCPSPKADMKLLEQPPARLPRRRQDRLEPGAPCGTVYQLKAGEVVGHGHWGQPALSPGWALDNRKGAAWLPFVEPATAARQAASMQSGSWCRRPRRSRISSGIACGTRPSMMCTALQPLCGFQRPAIFGIMPPGSCRRRSAHRPRPRSGWSAARRSVGTPRMLVSSSSFSARAARSPVAPATTSALML